MLRFLLKITAMLLTVVIPGTCAQGDVVWDESIQGDLSGDSLAPTVFVFAEGSNDVIGATVASPLDRDFWTMEILDGYRLESIVLSDYDVSGSSQSFFAVAEGTQISSLFDPSILLGNTLVGETTGRSEGDNVLDDLGEAFYGGTGFSGSLGPGQYTFWYQETGGETGYGFEFNVASVPEPGGGGLLCIGLLVLLFNSRRRFRDSFSLSAD